MKLSKQDTLELLNGYVQPWLYELPDLLVTLVDEVLFLRLNSPVTYRVSLFCFFSFVDDHPNEDLLTLLIGFNSTDIITGESSYSYISSAGFRPLESHDLNESYEGLVSKTIELLKEIYNVVLVKYQDDPKTTIELMVASSKENGPDWDEYEFKASVLGNYLVSPLIF